MTIGFDDEIGGFAIDEEGAGRHGCLELEGFPVGGGEDEVEGVALDVHALSITVLAEGQGEALG